VPDGLKIIFTAYCSHGSPGDVKAVSYSVGKSLIQRGVARLVNPEEDPARDKVIDAFMFSNEIDMLEIRLHELDPVVDHFVILESLELHGSRRTKPATLRDNWHIVKPFEAKVTHVVLEHLEPEYTDAASGWQRENFQRQALQEPVSKLLNSPQNVVIVSDCDEIPRADVAHRALPTVQRLGLHRLSLDLYFYNVNCYVENWTRSSIGTFDAYMAAGGFQAPRAHLDVPSKKVYPVIPNAGWHFSNFFSVADLKKKIETFAHSADAPFKEFVERSEAEIAAEIIAGKNIFHGTRVNQFAKRATLDPRLPTYFLRNLARFEKFTEAHFKRMYCGK
jgi:beta-1,4-mannosyl-glycoprotein beta-1,4-N-acetylglucosaminyltransferase